MLVAVSDGTTQSRSEVVTITPTTIQLVTTATLTKLADGSYQATVTVTNNGFTTAEDVQLTEATLGAASGTPLPLSLGDIAAGESAVTTIIFPASAGDSGAAVVERYSGTYTGGTFTGSIRAILP